MKKYMLDVEIKAKNIKECKKIREKIVKIIEKRKEFDNIVSIDDGVWE